MDGGSGQRTAEIDALAGQPRPFAALYEHWERHHWSPFAVDFSVDAATFAGLDTATQQGLVWIFAHRFQAEFNVAALADGQCGPSLRQRLQPEFKGPSQRLPLYEPDRSALPELLA